MTSIEAVVEQRKEYTALLWLQEYMALREEMKKAALTSYKNKEWLKTYEISVHALLLLLLWTAGVSRQKGRNRQRFVPGRDRVVKDFEREHF